jgi:fibro-slime domain-containing protein
MNTKMKKILAVVLGVALLISAIPAALLLRKGAQNPTSLNAGEINAGEMPSGQEYISMPITLRDFAADGMLFEFTQFEDPDDFYVASPTSYTGLKAYFSEASDVDMYKYKGDESNAKYQEIYKTGQWRYDGTNNTRYVKYWPHNSYGMKLSFKLAGSNNGDNYVRDDVDFVVLKFRTSGTADKYVSITPPDAANKGVKYSVPFIAQRGPQGTVADPYGSGLLLYNKDRDLDSVYPDYKYDDLAIKDSWKEMMGTSEDGTGEWQYTLVNLGSNATAEVTYLSLYLNQKGGHFDFGGLWVFDSRANAKTFIDKQYQYEQYKYYIGDNKGYGLLMTDTNDFVNSLPYDSSNPTASNIAGSRVWLNGSWSDTKEPSAKKATLNSNTIQYVYGAVIRTDLVEPQLGSNGKPVYTDATISYLQSLLKQTLPTVWQRADQNGFDGVFNLYYIMGIKLYNDNWEYVGPGHADATKDLAQLLRDKITADGTLEETKAKVAAGNLRVPTDVETYFDAAYYLLHNTWSDSAADSTSNDGYGMRVDEYTHINLIQTTNSAGQKCYVFNSGYDDTVYDKESGLIYNSQLTTMTKVKDPTVHSTGIIRGMIMPEARFDPIRGLGYGESGNTYAEQGLRTDGWADTYYANTNYNLSLEGHAEFVYYEDANQYFTFTGDDDVYLYIDGVRVLDLGGAHSISKVSIKLNEIAAKLGLVDGQTYDFDFFYMERHGTAANFSIETNIQIVDPAMTTGKTGYQNGINTGYNGYVDATKPVTYEFSLENKGNEAIKDLQFIDTKLGVAISKDSLTLNSITTIDKLSLSIYNADGTVKVYQDAGTLTGDTLKEYLKAGLAVGEKMTIYGFDYLIADTDWETRELEDGTTSNSYFYNTVNTLAVSSTGQNLSGVSHWVVQKKAASFEDVHLYTWGYLDTTTVSLNDLHSGGSVELYRSELNAVIENAGLSVTGSEAIKLSNPTGITDPTLTNNINTKASISGDTITYTATGTGVDYYYVMVGKYGPIRVAVYTYGVADSTFVLDYNLPVKLTAAALTSNSVVDIAGQNPFGTTYTIGVGNATSNYGTFAVENDLTYSMNKIMNGIDTQEVTLIVREKGSEVAQGTEEEITKFNGVVMPKTVTVVPASIMYYEENFVGEGALVYSNGEAWVQYGSGNDYQSDDQDMNYGFDPNYSIDKVAPSGLQGDASNGTIRVHTVGAGAYKLMTFDFVGTGFEILSRTTDLDYCIMLAEVKNANGEIVRRLPVICESENGDLYQVPVISITGLTYGKYTVTLSVSNNASETNMPKVYMDGVRIYSPLTDEQEALYYSADEVNATITEVKQLVKDGFVVYAAKASDDNYILAVGDTAIENYDGTDGFVLKENVNINEYLQNGPNNELYLDGKNSGFSVIAFYVTADPNCSDAERSIQIGVHRKTDSVFGNKTDNTDYVTFVYGSNSDALTNGYYSTKVQSGTEQYYSIDISNLEADDQGRYLVIVGMSSNNVNGLMPVLSITNLKLSGFTLTAFDLELQNMQGNE